nr:MAG TPA: hypothetical protein [Caudoviricetes sp.]
MDYWFIDRFVVCRRKIDMFFFPDNKVSPSYFLSFHCFEHFINS